MMKRIPTVVLGAFASAFLSISAVAGTTVYVPMGTGNEILIIDAETDQITGKITDVSEVHGLAGAANGKYLVAGSFAEFDPGESSAPPKPMSVSEDEHRAHHAKSATKTPQQETQSFISVIRIADGNVIPRADGNVVRRIVVPGAVHHVALTPDGKYAMATHPGQDSVSVVNLAKATLLKSLKTGPTPNYAVISRDGKRAYVSNAGNNTVSEISTESWAELRTLPTGETPEHLALATNGEAIYVANVDDGTVSAIALRGEAATQTFSVGGLLHGIDLSDDGRTAFVSGTEENKLVAIDLASGQLQSIPVGPSPYHLATITGTGKIYLSSADEPKLWVIDQKTLRVRGDIKIDGKGHQMVVLNR